MSVPSALSDTRLWSDAAALYSKQVAAAAQTSDRAMASIIDSLVNQLLPVRTQNTGLSAPLRSGVIEALVLNNSPLLNTTDGQAQIRVSLSSGEQRLELTTSVPLPVGAKVQLKLSADNLAVLLKIDDPSARQTTAASSRPALQQSLGQPLPVSTRVLTDNLQPLLNTNPAQAASLSTGPTSSTATELPLLLLQQRQSVASAVRQALPQQQPLRDLLPVLQSVLRHPQPLPKPLTLAITQLIQQFPRPEQLQHSQPLKQAMNNSGTFLESKLAQPAQDNSAPLQRLGSQAISNEAGKTGEPLSRDLKAMIEKILPQIQQLAPGAKESGEPGAPTSPLATSYGAIPVPAAPISPSVSHSNAAKHKADQSLDVLLRQLSRQLMASLARTQLNQLESIGNRQAFTNDPQSPINSWILELPILHGQRVDNLDVRIEQREESGAEKRDSKTMVWTVMLNFDLHQLGRMQVQLSIIEKSVSAMIWSQLQETHSQVRKHINDLRSGLEKVGVKVKKVECHMGIPPTDRGQLYRQLVDLHT